MHIRLLAILAVSLLTASMSVAQGIAFESGSWADALSKAKKENKLIFLDAYTSWCGPCKMMSKNTFTDKGVGDLYNARFVNMKVDMENGEGIQIAERYGVQAYPTLLFVDAEGSVAHRALGYHDPAQFITLGQQAADPARNMLGLDQRYQKGDRDPQFIMQYLEAKSAAFDPQVEKVAVEFLNTQRDLQTADSRKVIMEYVNDPKSKYFDYFLEHQEFFVAEYGQVRVDGKKQMALSALLETDTPPTPEEMAPMLQKLFPADAKQYQSLYAMSYYQGQGDINGFAKAAIDYYDHYNDATASDLNEIAWTFYEQVENKEQLQHALKWAERSVALEEQYFNLDTLAALHYKTGNKKKARQYAKKAIEKAKSTGEDYSETEALLKKM
ncbi:MAG: thioredoxin family protein [Saprospiraceae bacterium]